MAKQKMMTCLLAAGVLALWGCSEDGPAGISRGHGMLSPSVGMDATVKAPRQNAAPQSRAEVPEASMLSLRLSSTDGSFTKEWATVGEFSTTEEFAVGSYTLEAWYGTAGAEGFDCAYYHGECPVSIEDRKTTTVALTAALSQALVDVTYTETFRHFMTEYSAKVNGHAVAAGETRPVYITPGNVSVLVDFTKPNGDKGTNYEVAKFVAQAQTHYHVTVDLAGGAGDASIVVTYDDELDTQEVIIDISDLVMNAPAPAVTPEGFASGDAIDFVAGMAPSEAVKMNIIAQGGLKEMRLTTVSQSLLAQGWPAEIDLLAATAQQQATLQQLGLKALGLWNNPDKMAVVDFSEVASHINYVEGGDNTTTFSLTVKDANFKVSEAVGLSLNCEKLVLTITGAEALQSDRKPTIYVDYNGADMARNVTFMVGNDRGTYDVVTDVEISAPTSRATASYTVTFPSITATEAFNVKAVCGGNESNTYTLRPAPFEVAVNNNDVYARHAFVTVNGTEGETRPQATLVEGAKYYISTDGSTWSEVSATPEGLYTHVDNLQPATTYYIKAVIDGLSSRSTTFTTESALQVANGGMEDWCQTESESHWERVYPGSSESECVWGTNNPMTTSQGGNYAYCRISGTISADGASGKCALIRTVGWGSGNTATGSGGASGKTKYIDAGLLHLGAARAERPEGYKNTTGTIGTADLDCGIAFGSRPASLSFKYKYTAKNSADKGLAEFWVKDSQGNTIASGTRQLEAAGNWTEVSLPMVSPAQGTAKAAKIYVKFLSTCSEEFLTKTNDNLSGPGFANLSRGTFMGSQLYIDDITLNY